MIRAGKVPDGMTVAEVNAYINYMTKQHEDIHSGTLDIELTEDGEDVELTLTPDVVRFQRIRRITAILWELSTASTTPNVPKWATG